MDLKESIQQMIASKLEAVADEVTKSLGKKEVELDPSEKKDEAQFDPKDFVTKFTESLAPVIGEVVAKAIDDKLKDSKTDEEKETDSMVEFNGAVRKLMSDHGIGEGVSVLVKEEKSGMILGEDGKFVKEKEEEKEKDIDEELEALDNEGKEEALGAWFGAKINS